jgi:hypothetical protein
MNRTVLSGLVLAALGVLLFLLGGTEFKKQEEVFRVGSFSARATTKKTVPALRYAGGGALALGILVMGFGWIRKK